MIYLIGGPARCGKSTLARRVRKEIDGLVLDGDAFVHALQATLKPEWEPDIFDHAVANIRGMHDNQTMIDRLRRRDEAMWQFYDAYFNTALRDEPESDMLLEGNLWPDYLELFDASHRAVFLIDTSPEHYERIKTIRDSDSSNNWMKEYSDDHLQAWAEFNQARSERYKQLCEGTNYPYFDIAEYGLEDSQQRAFEYLLQKSV